MKTPASAFKFVSFIIEESWFKQKPGKKEKFELSILPKGTLHKTKKIFQLDLFVEVTESNENLNAKIHAIGIFNFKGVVNKEELKTYFFLNAPAIVFPYVRAHVATLSALSGSGELINLPPLNIASLRKELEENTIEVD